MSSEQSLGSLDHVSCRVTLAFEGVHNETHLSKRQKWPPEGGFKLFYKIWISWDLWLFRIQKSHVVLIWTHIQILSGSLNAAIKNRFGIFDGLCEKCIRNVHCHLAFCDCVHFREMEAEAGWRGGQHFHLAARRWWACLHGVCMLSLWQHGLLLSFFPKSKEHVTYETN